MKMNKKHMHAALMHTLVEYGSMKTLASKVVSHIADGDGAEVQEVKSTGFTVRCKKDVDVSDSKMYKIIARGIRDIFDDHIDDVLDYMADNYDIAYDSGMVDEDFSETIFEVMKSGRLIYVVMDS